jgi:hypothetical protein
MKFRYFRAAMLRTIHASKVAYLICVLANDLYQNKNRTSLKFFQTCPVKVDLIKEPAICIGLPGITKTLFFGQPY